MTRCGALVGLACVLCGTLAGGCQRFERYLPRHNPALARGIELTTHYGCISCHDIPGATVSGKVGPELRDVHARPYIAGGLANTPDNLVMMIRFPDRARPGTLMPNLGVPESDAREMAAFFYALR